MVKIEQGVDAEEGRQEEAGAGRAVQRRRVGEAGDAAWDEVQMLRLNMEAQAQAIQGMERTRVLGEALQRANVRVSELSTQNAVLAGELKANAEALQAKDIIIQLNQDLLKAKEYELLILRADIARRNAGSSEAVSASRPLPLKMFSLQAASGVFATTAHNLFGGGKRLYGQQNFRDAAERWGQAALQQHAPSHAHLSDMLIDGRAGVTVDEKRAFELAAAGAALGCAHSKGALGRCYAYGLGVAKDAACGLALGRESAAAGSCFGQYVVGKCYEAGWGVAQDYAEAVRLYRLAADQGHAAAQFNLGTMLDFGEGVAKDREEAVRLIRLAADQGHADAQVKLGEMFEYGEGVAKDGAEAIRLYHLAAEQGIFLAGVHLTRLGAT